MKTKLFSVILSLFIFSFANPVFAQAITDPEQQPLVRMLREFSFFLNIVLVIMVILLSVTLRGALKYLGGKDSLKNKVFKVYYFLSKEPAQLFSQMAQRDKTGTFLLPFESYRKLHHISRKIFFRTLGLAAIQIGVIIFLIYGVSLIGHHSEASDDSKSKSMKSDNFILELDK